MVNAHQNKIDIVDRLAGAIELEKTYEELIDELAKRYSMDYIVTRNTKDFINSIVPAITPKERV